MARLKVGSAIVVKGDDVVGVFTAVDGLRALAELLSAAAGSASVKQVRPGRDVDADGAAVIGDDAVNDREAEARCRGAWS